MTIVPPVICALLLAIAAAASAVRAETIRLSPGGKPGSVQAALDRAKPGDTVLLAPGVYRERVHFKASGTFGKPVVLEGAPGAVLDGSEPVTLDWKAAPDIAPGVYRAPVSFLPFTVVADGKIITTLREDRVRPGGTKVAKEWEWPTVFKNGIGPSGWKGVKALALYLPDKKELLLRFGDNRDPRKAEIAVAPKEAVVRIAGANRCVVRGLLLKNAAYGVYVENALGAVVENCVIGPTDHGVWMDKGSDRCTVRFNEIFQDPLAGADPRGEGAWDNWQAHKTGGFYDRYAVQIHATRGGHEIHDNNIHDHWGGVEDRGGAGENVGIRVHHNRIRTINDDALEPNGAEENAEWHDNLVERSRCGFRIKAPTVGPLYIYRNIFFDSREDFRNYGEVELKPAVVFVYHNTSTAPSAISSNKVFGIGTPNYHYVNNLFVAEYWWRDTGKSVLPNWEGDYNVYARRGTDSRWDASRALAAKQNLDAHSVWTTESAAGLTNVAARDVRLGEKSAARGKGMDLSRRYGKPLPGCAPGYFTGAAPDVGAIPFGAPLPLLPRKRSGVQNLAPAGSWPGPEADKSPSK